MYQFTLQDFERVRTHPVFQESLNVLIEINISPALREVEPISEIEVDLINADRDNYHQLFNNYSGRQIYAAFTSLGDRLPQPDTPVFIPYPSSCAPVFDTPPSTCFESFTAGNNTPVALESNPPEDPLSNYEFSDPNTRGQALPEISQIVPYSPDWWIWPAEGEQGFEQIIFIELVAVRILFPELDDLRVFHTLNDEKYINQETCLESGMYFSLDSQCHCREPIRSALDDSRFLFEAGLFLTCGYPPEEFYENEPELVEHLYRLQQQVLNIV